MWVTRNQDGSLHLRNTRYPSAYDSAWEIDSSLCPDLKFKDEPREVEITKIELRYVDSKR